jgi:hypothetical protein
MKILLQLSQATTVHHAYESDGHKKIGKITMWHCFSPSDMNTNIDGGSNMRLIASVWWKIATWFAER